MLMQEAPPALLPAPVEAERAHFHGVELSWVFSRQAGAGRACGGPKGTAMGQVTEVGADPCSGGEGRGKSRGGGSGGKWAASWGLTLFSQWILAPELTRI